LLVPLYISHYACMAVSSTRSKHNESGKKVIDMATMQVEKKLAAN
jgi:hypothetical protein